MLFVRSLILGLQSRKGAGYHAFYFNPADAADYLPKVYEMVQSMDSSEVASFFQQVRTTENPEYS